MNSILGLDIGGANTKACYLEIKDGEVTKSKSKSVYYEVWRNPHGLKNILNEIKDWSANDEGITSNMVIAVTMTAELCDVFQSKTQGVTFLTTSVLEMFESIPVYVWTLNNTFLKAEEIQKKPLQAAAANWLASATALANCSYLKNRTVLFADMGSTTTDLIPIQKGRILWRGRTDTERLVAGELIYTGLLRTSVSSILDYIYLDGRECSVMNEYFALTADAYRVLERIDELDYDVPAPDGGSKDISGCARRLARIIAADSQDVGRENIYLMAQYIQEKQIQIIMDCILKIISRKELFQPDYVITTGQGDFLIREIARRLNYSTLAWYDVVPGAQSNQVMTAYCTAWLLSQQMKGGLT